MKSNHAVEGDAMNLGSMILYDIGSDQANRLIIHIKP